MKTKAFILIALGFCWLAIDANLIIGDVTLRETSLGVIARVLDRLPTPVGNPIFIGLWFTLLLGWTIALAFGFWRLFRGSRSN
jgi:hypothetical protein